MAHIIVNREKNILQRGHQRNALARIEKKKRKTPSVINEEYKIRRIDLSSFNFNILTKRTL